MHFPSYSHIHLEISVDCANVRGGYLKLIDDCLVCMFILTFILVENNKLN